MNLDNLAVWFVFFKKLISDAYTIPSYTIKDSHDASNVYAELLLGERRGPLLAFTLCQPLCLMMELQDSKICPQEAHSLVE